MGYSIGICAHNDEKNIGQLLDSLRKNSEGALEIIIVASGCTDSTESIVRSRMRKDKRIKLLMQEKKEGKASAINLILGAAKGGIVALISADVLAGQGTLEALIKPFSDPKIGMSGGRPVPVNREDSLCGYFVNLEWRLHHEVSLSKPKPGEIVAFRKILEKIPEDTAVDEAYIESVIAGRGYSIVYAPDAVVSNRGPESLRELVGQRKRIFIGHLDLRRRTGHAPSTMRASALFKPLLNEVLRNPLKVHFLAACVLIEAYSRIAAYFDYYVLKINPYNWETLKSTKGVKQG